ncbi:Pyridoxamine 5'-phosphate oxidase [Planctomycetes bacterium CA13]|uniref:Pyridoxamine 5'-phosphate oxidase n=1 Tax=Novipirellula herctigrandis TaxID=2527986 RepID=A0A5C5Z1E7_9BACT|nr:Pyridoxamine 5'-phosphate oxidase [Planctomycetes bacterium CA13]
MNNRDTIQSILKTAKTGSLGTVGDDNVPFVSLVTVASMEPQSLILLLSSLAKHTQNLTYCSKCSLLLAESASESAHPLAGVRVTMTGNMARIKRGEDADARAIFLSTHPDASMYADFGDFGFFELRIKQAHLVAGFGRIQTLAASELLT